MPVRHHFTTRINSEDAGATAAAAAAAYDDDDDDDNTYFTDYMTTHLEIPRPT
jgi:hypothetical protein